ncbi:hypothetical protein J6590_059397 [Homalodisca vitripennis]|nr:hypothetical protein J6590_059397 [Homalodisca vitripennis]
MYNSPYKNLLDCIIRVYRAEGLLAFYRSYTTQLAMNLPFQSFHFVMYELCQNLWNPERTYNPAVHMASGAIAGGVAAAITTPLDVCKTLLNTQEGTLGAVRSFLLALSRTGANTIYAAGHCLRFWSSDSRGSFPQATDAKSPLNS